AAQKQAAEATHVPIAELAAVAEGQDRVQMIRLRSVLLHAAPLTGHPQVDDQQGVLPRRTVQVVEEVLAAPAHGLDRAADQLSREALRVGVAHDGREAHLTAGYGPAHQLRAQVGSERLYLRQLRHFLRSKPRLTLPDSAPPL